MNRNKFTQISIIFSCISIITSVLRNYKLATQYISSDGKTKALFGIVELTKMTNHIFCGIATIISILLLYIAYRKNENYKILIIGFLLIFLSMTLNFARIWKLMI